MQRERNKYPEVNLLDSSFETAIRLRKEYLDRYVARLKKDIAKAPSGMLRISPRKTYTQYYWRQSPSDRNGVYIRAKDKKLAVDLAQRDYNKCLLNIIEEERQLAAKYCSLLEEKPVARVHDSLNRYKQELVISIEDENEAFVAGWKAEQYEKMSIDATTEFYSNNGIRVRSKSELIIANMLEQYDVPYKYEKPIILKGIGTVHPDFTCLNTRTHKEIVWEHFGMMDNEAYASKNIIKLNTYNQNGYYIGKNMIASFETSQNPLSSRFVKAMIEEYLI